MKSKALSLALVFILALSVLAVTHPRPAAAGQTLNTLTINLLFSEVKDRPARLTKIAKFAAQQKINGTPVDVILLQEVVGGVLVGTKNSAQDLRNLLAARGMTYYLSYRFEEGLPGVLMVGNAILSRYPILLTVTRTLPFVEYIHFEGIDFPIRRIVMMARLALKNKGRVNVYNTHLSSEATDADRLKQVQALLDFLENIEKNLPGDNPIILGGDFNTNLNFYKPMYQELITNHSFTDTYAVFNNCFSCCPPPDGGDLSGCTYALTGNPYINPPGDMPQRLDYLLARGIADVVSSQVVFKSGTAADPWVSDHSGVLSRVQLP